METSREGMEIRKISVKQEDIDYAVRQHRWRCAIVRAIQREYPDALYVRVDKEVIAWSDCTSLLRYQVKTPSIAVNKVIKPLDRGEEAKPTTFTLPEASVTPMDTRTREEKRVNRNRQRIRAESCNTNGHARNRFTEEISNA
jgi:hypothetical protein